METHKAYLSKQINVNGKVISDEIIKTDYDGKNLAIDVYENGQHYYSKLNNNDIASILSHKASSLPLEKRLMKDFSIKGKYKSNKKKTNKKSKQRKNNNTYKKR